MKVVNAIVVLKVVVICKNKEAKVTIFCLCLPIMHTATVSMLKFKMFLLVNI